MKDKIIFYQINLNKCFAAQANLMVELTGITNSDFICLIQEPHFSGQRPSSIDRRFMQVFHGSYIDKSWPRAMILTSKNLKVSLIESLTSRDITCINLHNVKEEYIICSSYQDITFTEVINNIDRSVVYANSNGKEILIGSDTNSHSHLWMSNPENSRGEIFMDFISLNNLFVSNQGNKHTYDYSLGKSIIDVTMSTIGLVDKIRDWLVHDEDYFSDHKLITFTLDMEVTPMGKSRNLKTANWVYFKQIITNKKWKAPTFWSKKIIDLEAMKLNKVIIEALDKVCPEETLKTKDRNPTWWTNDLCNKKAKLKALKNEWKKASSNPEAVENIVKEKHLAYQSMRKDFSREIRKSKRESWNSFTSNTVDIYSLNKIIFKKQQNSISMMEGCHTGLETNNTLLDSHFPGSQSIEHQLIDDLEPSELKLQDSSLSEKEKISNKDLISNNFLDLHFLDPLRVREAFKDMNAWNSGGPDKLKSVVFQNLPFSMLERISKIYKVVLL